jgi:hypothetical protein
VSVKAVYEKLEYTIAVTGGSYTVDGASGGAAGVGQTVALTVDLNAFPQDMTFRSWGVVSGGMSDTDIGYNGKFVMPASDVEIEAVYKDVDPNMAYTITVIGGAATNNDAVPVQTGSAITARYRDDITLSAGNVPAGHRFAGWEVDAGYVVVVNSDHFMMLAHNVVITALFEKLNYLLAVLGGSYTVDGAAGTGTAQIGQTVVLTPGAAPAGYTFDKWQMQLLGGGDPQAVSGGFLMPAGDAVVRIIFKLTDVQDVEDILDKKGELDPEDYDPDTWKELEDAADEWKDALDEYNRNPDDPDAQRRLKDAYDRLLGAWNNLTVNTGNLERAVNSAKNEVNPKGWSKSSYRKYKDALAAAESILNDIRANGAKNPDGSLRHSQKEIDAAQRTLESSRKGLKSNVAPIIAIAIVGFVVLDAVVFYFTVLKPRQKKKRAAALSNY